MVDWDRRYREGFYHGVIEPHGLVTKFWPAIPGRRTVDIAMGSGRDALFLAEKGFFVAGLERSMGAIDMAKKTAEEKGVGFSPVLGDAKRLPFKNNSFDAAVIFYFLLREACDDAKRLVRKGGILMYETFLKRQNEIDGWRNPDHLLDDGELFRYFGGFDVLFYEEVMETSGSKQRAIARAVGRKK